MDTNIQLSGTGRKRGSSSVAGRRAEMSVLLFLDLSRSCSSKFKSPTESITVKLHYCAHFAWVLDKMPLSHLKGTPVCSVLVEEAQSTEDLCPEELQEFTH